MEKFKTQIGQSVTCDFHENTWTFEMPKGFCWTGGKFAIVPDDVFEKLQSDKQTLLEALKEARNTIESLKQAEAFRWSANTEAAYKHGFDAVKKYDDIIKANT